MLRMRLFVAKKKKGADKDQEPFKWSCPFCKKSWDKLKFSRRQEKYDPTMTADSTLYDTQIDAYFDGQHTMDSFTKLRSFYCTKCPPGKGGGYPKTFRTMKDLERHLEKSHSLYYCEACLETQNVYIHERELFTTSALTNHYKYGTPAKGENAPIAPHPFCLFCNTPYYTDDELYVHLTTKHKQCRLCRNTQMYFRNDRDLFNHQTEHHYVCTHPDCNQNYNSVAAFRDELDLRAHQVSVHKDKSMSRALSLGLGFNQQADRGGSSRVGSNQRRGRNRFADGYEFKSQDEREMEAIRAAEEAKFGKDTLVDDNEPAGEDFPSLGSSIAARAAQANAQLSLQSNQGIQYDFRL